MKPSTDWTEAVDHLRAADPKLAPFIERVGPCRLEPTGIESPFEALVETIVHQQLTGKAAATIYGRVAGLFRGGITPKKLLGAGEAKLRTAGLSGPKIRSIEDLARRALDGSLPLDRIGAMPDAALSEALLQVKGIGPWSVQMVMIFRLGRPDVWPVSDLGIRKGAQRVWNFRDLPDATQLERVGKRLSPHRSVASWYLWRCAELSDILARP